MHRQRLPQPGLVSPEHLAEAPAARRQALVRRLLSSERDGARPADIETVFGPSRLPGTTSIGLRREAPELFQDTLHCRLETYDCWLPRVIDEMIDGLVRARVLVLYDAAGSADRFRARAAHRVRSLLELADAAGRPLRDQIPQQIYEDVFLNLLQFACGPGGFPHRPELYREFNALCHRLGMALLHRLNAAGDLACGDRSLRRLIRLAVLSGYVGINLKSSASAASTLLNCDQVPLEPHWIATPAAVAAISNDSLQGVNERLVRLTAESRFGLDSTDRYFEEVVDTREPLLLAFFSDDYLESLIDLKRMEVMLQRNPKLAVLFIPRNGRYGNDLAFSDLALLLADPVFEGLRSLQHQGRFQTSALGPMAGCIDPRFVSSGLIRQILNGSRDRRLVLETKGCRNFEMLQGGLRVSWYASFNCNRALSIRTVGIDFEPVFLHIPPGARAYEGFRDPVVGNTPSGRSRDVRFARITTWHLYAKLAAGRVRSAQTHPAVRMRS